MITNIELINVSTNSIIQGNLYVSGLTILYGSVSTNNIVNNNKRTKETSMQEVRETKRMQKQTFDKVK